MAPALVNIWATSSGAVTAFDSATESRLMKCALRTRCLLASSECSSMPSVSATVMGPLRGHLAVAHPGHVHGGEIAGRVTGEHDAHELIDGLNLDEGGRGGGDGSALADPVGPVEGALHLQGPGTRPDDLQPLLPVPEHREGGPIAVGGRDLESNDFGEPIGHDG